MFDAAAAAFVGCPRGRVVCARTVRAGKDFGERRCINVLHVLPTSAATIPDLPSDLPRRRLVMLANVQKTANPKYHAPPASVPGASTLSRLRTRATTARPAAIAALAVEKHLERTAS